MLQPPEPKRMKAKHQRLVLALLALVAIVGAGLLAASALKDEAAYFYAPSELASKGVAPGQAIRLGGMVVPGSLAKEADGVTLRFEASDGKATVPVRFAGIAPDLFKEGSGMIADGRLGSDGVFVADKILAKHDERYMPAQMEMSPEMRAEMERHQSVKSDTAKAYGSSDNKVAPAQ